MMNVTALLSHVPISNVLAELRIASSTFRSYCSDLRENLSADDFDFQPHDRAISLRSYAFLKSYAEISKILGKKKALQHLKINGIED